MPDDEGQDTGREERHPERRQQAPVFAVAPVRARHALPRAALVGVVIGVLAFVAGIAVASTGPTERAPAPRRAVRRARRDDALPRRRCRPPSHS